MAYLNAHGLETFKGKLDIDKAKAASLAPIFSTATTYASGARVVKDGVLYEFTASHAAGAWTGSDAKAVQVGQELSDLNNQISDITDTDFYTDYGWEQGGLAGADGSETVRSDRIRTKFLQNVARIKSINDYRAYVCFYKADKTYISNSGLVNNIDLSADSFPANTVYIRIALGKGTTISVLFETRA